MVVNPLAGMSIDDIAKKAQQMGASQQQIQSGYQAIGQQPPSATIQSQPAPQVNANLLPQTQTSTQSTPSPFQFGDTGGASSAQRATGPGVQQATQQWTGPKTMNFGDLAKQTEQQSPGYLQWRNDQLATGLFKQGIIDTSAIYDQLSQLPSFAQASAEDKANTAQAIANRIGQMGQQPQDFDAGQYAVDQGFIANLDQITDREIERKHEDFWQQIEQAGRLGYDRPIEDLERNMMLQNRALDRALENTRFAINNQIEDVALQAQRNINMGEKIGALKGFGKSSGYVQGLANIRDDADRMISRLQEQLARAEQYTGEDKAQVLEDFNRQLGRVKEDFNFQMRDLMDLAKVNRDDLLAKYSLSSDKLQGKLDSLTLDVLQKRENLIGSYIQNTRNTIGIFQDQISTLEQYDSFINQERDRFTSILNMDGGAALSGLSTNQLRQEMEAGRLSPAQFNAYIGLQRGKAINTLIANGNPTQQDIDQLINLLDTGVSPAAALMRIMSDNPSRYRMDQQDWKPVPGMPGMFYTQGPDGQPIFSTAPQMQQQQTGIPQVGQQVNMGGNMYQITNLGGRTSTDGVDFAPLTPGSKEPVGAFEGGTFLRSGTDASTGNKFVEVMKDNGYVYRYNHLDSFGQFNAGDRIEAGQAIGVMGNSGRVEGPTGVHLDVGVYSKDRATNTGVQPLPIEQQRNILFGASQSTHDIAYKELYDAYLNNGKLPATTALKGMGKTTEQFIRETQSYKNSGDFSREPKFANIDQSNAFGFANRVSNTIGIFDSLEDRISRMSATAYYAAYNAPNWMQSPQMQQQKQAERDFVNAVLRRESGAAISESEFKNARLQYFPQPGDKKEVLEQKRNNRVQQLQNLAQSSGNNWYFEDIIKGVQRTPATSTEGSTEGTQPNIQGIQNYLKSLGL